MHEKPITIIYEDQLSEAVLYRLLEFSKQTAVIHQKISGNGCDYIKKRIPSYLAASRIIPFVILLDSDQEECAKRMLDALVPTAQRHSGFHLRIAVHEVEAWLLADHQGFGKFLGISPTLVNRQPESIIDAKAYLISLARRSKKREIQDGMVPQYGTSARQGPRYNQVLIPFVQKSWNILAAIKRSESLSRALEAIKKAPFQP